jgi:hypothetical protein
MNLTQQIDAAIRENGYRAAHLDLLTVLTEMKKISNQFPSKQAHINFIIDEFEKLMAIRALNNFSLHQSDTNGLV